MATAETPEQRLERVKQEQLSKRHAELMRAQQAQKAREAQGSEPPAETTDEGEAREDAIQAELDRMAMDGEVIEQAQDNQGVTEGSTEPENVSRARDVNTSQDDKHPPRRKRTPSKRHKEQEAVNPELSNVPAVVLSEATATHLNLPMDLSWGKWKTYGKYLRVLEKGAHWWIGDWMLYTDQRGKDWEEQGIQYADELGFAANTLVSDRAVAKQFSPVGGNRQRHEKLSFSHHVLVAYLSPKISEELLNRAEVGDGRNPWSTRELEDEIRSRRAKGIIAERTTKRGLKAKQEEPKQEANGVTPPAAAAGGPPRPLPTDPQGPQLEQPDDDLQAPADDDEDFVDDVYDYAAHTELRNRACDVMRGCIQVAMGENMNDLDPAYASVCQTLDALMQLRESYERLGVEPQ